MIARGARHDRARARARARRRRCSRSARAWGSWRVRLVRKDAPEQLTALIGAAGSFAAVSFIFGSPLIGAVILIEAAALDRRGLQVVLPVGLLASGIGALVSTGIGSWDGLSSSDFALEPLQVPDFARPDVVGLRLDDPAGGRDRARRVRDLRARPAPAAARDAPPAR